MTQEERNVAFLYFHPNYKAFKLDMFKGAWTLTMLGIKMYEAFHW